MIHGENLNRPRADAKKTGQNPGNKHDAKAGRNVLRNVGLAAFLRRVVSAELQSLGQLILLVLDVILLVVKSAPGRVKQGNAKNDAYGMGRDAGGKVRASYGAQRRGHLKKHSDPHIGKSFPDVGDCGARRSSDHGNKRRTNGVANIDMKEEGERGHDDHTTAKTGQGAEQSGQNRDEEYRESIRPMLIVLLASHLRPFKTKFICRRDSVAVCLG